MSEEKTPEVELNDKPASGVSGAVNTVVNETVKLIDSLARAVAVTAEDISNMMVIKVDADTREHLDLLVGAGVAKTRQKAAVGLIKESIEAKADSFERIRRTKEQIAELRKQMRTLVEVRSA